MATKKRRYDEGGKATASSPPPAPAKKKKSKLMLGGLGGLIPMAIQKEGVAGLSPAAMVKKYGVEVLSPMAMAMRRSRRLGPPPATTQAATPPPPPPPPQRIIYPTYEEDRAPPSPAEEASGGMRRGGKAKSKPKGYAKGGAVMDPGGYRIGGGRGTHRYAKDGDGWRMDASEFKVLKDITARDLADIEKGKRPGASKLDKMAAAEAERRQNRQGYASKGYDEDTGIGLMRKSRISDPAKRAASDAVRPKVYKAKGGKVSSRGDGIARKGKTKGRYI